MKRQSRVIRRSGVVSSAGAAGLSSIRPSSVPVPEDTKRWTAMKAKRRLGVSDLAISRFSLLFTADPWRLSFRLPASLSLLDEDGEDMATLFDFQSPPIPNPFLRSLNENESSGSSSRSESGESSSMSSGCRQRRRPRPPTPLPTDALAHRRPRPMTRAPRPSWIWSRRCWASVRFGARASSGFVACTRRVYGCASFSLPPEEEDEAWQGDNEYYARAFVTLSRSRCPSPAASPLLPLPHVPSPRTRVPFPLATLHLGSDAAATRALRREFAAIAAIPSPSTIATTTTLSHAPAVYLDLQPPPTS
ncbi:hypothetical protein K438DRAFT_4508 [Mycena galopus ATCC 62051]|nr:hypothetical protein K438DRAFT_4508 [Mycena galopus ATCC 62051]